MFGWLLSIAGECDPITNGLRLLDCTVGGNASYSVPVGAVPSGRELSALLRSNGIPVRHMGILEGGQTIIFNVPRGQAQLAESVMTQSGVTWWGG